MVGRAGPRLLGVSHFDSHVRTRCVSCRVLISVRRYGRAPGGVLEAELALEGYEADVAGNSGVSPREEHQTPRGITSLGLNLGRATPRDEKGRTSSKTPRGPENSDAAIPPIALPDPSLGLEDLKEILKTPRGEIVVTQEQEDLVAELMAEDSVAVADAAAASTAGSHGSPRNAASAALNSAIVFARSSSSSCGT